LYHTALVVLKVMKTRHVKPLAWPVTIGNCLASAGVKGARESVSIGTDDPNLLVDVNLESSLRSPHHPDRNVRLAGPPAY
jgi:hypothetical protein